MELFVPALWVASGISLYAGLQFGIYGYIRRQEKLFLAFGILSLLIGVYTIFSAQWYRAETIDAIGDIARIEMGIVCLLYPAFIWFISLYTYQKSLQVPLLALMALFVVLFVINLWSDYSFLYRSIEMNHPIKLPWGEVVSGYKLDISVFSWPYYAATYVVFGWAFYRGFVLWKDNNRARAMPIMFYLALQFVSVIHGELIDNFNLNSVYTGEIAFLALTILVSLNLAQELRLRSQALEASNEDLRTETLRRMEYEHKLLHMANHDHLTDLPNRRALTLQIEQVVEACANRKGLGAMLMIDLDNFKMINDSLGHVVGDQLLKMVATRLLSMLTDGHPPIRLGGDEFAIIFDDLPRSEQRAEQVAAERAEQICKEVIKPYQIGEHKLVVGMSAGVTVFDCHIRDYSEIMKRADMAMYRAKSIGRNAVELFVPELEEEAVQRLTIDKDMRAAIENGEIQLYFQPQVDITGSMIGAEVLARWEHPKLGAISPVTFITVAEETGLIHTLGEYVLRQSCQYLKNWQNDNSIQPRRLSVNVSPWQFNGTGFSRMVTDAVEESGIKPSALNLEITESTFLRDIDSVSRVMNELNELGVTFSIDDFGTGYSALAWLKNLSVHELKIDRMFIRDMQIGHNDLLIETILAIARHMQLSVVAEGVENEYQRQALERMGCEAFQGYLISKPLPEHDFIGWIERNRKA